jgi:hypothetical protein
MQNHDIKLYREDGMKNVIKQLCGIVFVTVMVMIFAGCASMTLVTIDNVEGPNQMRQGEDLDPKTVTVWGIYKDDSRKVVNINASNITYNKHATGHQTVRVRVKNQEGSFQTEVMALRSLNIASQPRTTLFKVGQEPDRTWPGLEVRGEWDQMGSDRINTASCTITGYNKDQAGKQRISVSYEGITATFEVDVRAMTNLKLVQSPTKVDYLLGESLELAGLNVVGVWEGFPEEQLSIIAGDITGYNPDTSGVQRLTITKNGRSVTFNVDVWGLTGIVLDKPPDRTDYTFGEQLDLRGIVINGNYAGSTPAKRRSELIPASQLVVSGYNPNTVGRQQKVSVTVGGYVANFFVNITLPDPNAPVQQPQTDPSTSVQTTTPSTGPMTWGSVNSFGNTVNIAYGNGRYITVGDSVYIGYSNDGVNWTAVDRRSNPINGFYRGIAYGNGRWVAIGNFGIFYSDDNGVNWIRVDTSRIFPTTSLWYSVAWANGRWVAGGASGQMAYSDDGANWTAVNASGIFGNGFMYSIAYGNGRWIAAGSDGKMAYSTNNGVSWTAVDVSGLFKDRTIFSVAYGNGRWIAVSSYIGSTMAYSDNGVNWTEVKLEYNTGISTGLRYITYANGRWIATASGNMAYSSNGTTWTAVSNTTFGDQQITGLAYGNGRWVAVGSRVAYSDN